jgi:hypothetical protein
MIHDVPFDEFIWAPFRRLVQIFGLSNGKWIGIALAIALSPIPIGDSQQIQPIKV